MRMLNSTSRLLVICFFAASLTDHNQNCIAADEDADHNAPFLRIDSDGPLAYVTSLAFRQNPEDQQLVLHAAGWDKTVHSWNLSRGRDNWRYDRDNSLRVPIGPAYFGSANSMSISGDGEWLAVGGRGYVSGLSQEKQDGIIWPASTALTAEMFLELGTIFVFHLPTGNVTRLKGHAGTVLALTFVPGPEPVLVSAALEQDLAGQVEGKLRVWDVRGNRELSVLPRLPTRTGRPGLAAWRSGETLQSIRVGIAWTDVDPKNDKLRVWDVATNELSESTSATYLATTCFLPGSSQRLLTGVAEKLRVWTVSTRNTDKLNLLTNSTSRDLIALPALNGNQQIPVALAFIAGQGAGGDLVASIVRTSSQDPYRLIVVSIDSGRLVSDVPLWPGSSKLPVLAVDSSGQYLAVSGNDDNEIWVFRTEKVLAGRREGTEKQVLRSTARAIRSVSFAQQQNRLGIVIGKSVFPNGFARRTWQAEDQVFDVAQRRFGETRGWQNFDADSDNWHLTTSLDRNKLRVHVTQGTAAKMIEFDERDRLECWAACPATKSFGQSLFAVSVNHEGESQLWLFNMQTGARLRRLSGHVDRVTSLTFSRDGRFLVSASLDQTIRVWWLSDLNESLKSHAGLSGLEVLTDKDGKIVVKSDRTARFVSGDLLTVVDSRNPESPPQFHTAFDFYRYIADRKPGDRILVNVTGPNGEKKAKSELILEQCIDERKPLSSVFLFNDPKYQGISWISWDPLGRYDAALAESESRLGWHFNTNDANSPVRFAAAEKYREQNFWEGLLSDHFEQGPQLVKRPRPEPKTSLYLREGKNLLRSSPGEPILVRTGSLSAFLEVEGFPERLIGRVTCKVDDHEQEFELSAEGLWEASLVHSLTYRGLSKVIAAVTTREKPPRTFYRDVDFRLIPPAPTIAFSPKALPETAEIEKLDFAVGVLSPIFERSESVTVTVVHVHEGRQIDPREWEVTDKEPRPQQVLLKAGQNLITVIARNSKAPPEFQKLEESRKTFVVRLSEPQRPEIRQLGIVPPGEKTSVAIDADRPSITDSPNLDLRGKISVKSPDKLTHATYTLSENAKPVELSGFKSSSEFEVSQTVRLVTPGLQTITLSTESNRKMTDRISFDIIFKPALPVLKQLKIGAKERPLPAGHLLIEGRDEPDLTIEADFNPPAKATLFPHSAQIVLRLKSQAPMVERVVEFPAGDPKPFRETVRLNHGENELQLILRNNWTETILLTERFSVRRPPRIDKVQLPSESKATDVPLVAEIISSSALTRISVFRNGFEIPSKSIAVKAVPDATDRWTITTPISLDLDGKATIVELAAENADGECLQRSRREVTYIQPPPPVPEIRPEFAASIQTQKPVLEIPFRIRSAKPLESLQLHLDRGTNRVVEIPFVDLPKPDSDGYIAFRHPWSMEEMDEPIFKFFIEAKNAAGTARSAVAEVNYIHEPLQLVVDSLRPVNGEPFNRRGTRTIHFADAATARLELNGHLTRAESRHARVKIWVNGFLQKSVPVQPTGEFTSTIVLNLKSKNRISFDVPNTAIDKQTLPKLVLNCLSHQKPATLRLVTIIAADPQKDRQIQCTEQELQERILSAIRSRNPAIEHFLVGPAVLLSGNFTENNVTGVLANMRSTMSRQGDEPTNDILVIYYQGTEIHREQSEFELATGNSTSTLKRTTLVKLLGEIPGAHLLLLDVERQPPGVNPPTWSDPRLGLLRVTWSGEPKSDSDRFRLFDALEKSISKSDFSQLRLTLVASRLADAYQNLRGKSPHVEFTSEIPEDLEQLVLTP